MWHVHNWFAYGEIKTYKLTPGSVVGKPSPIKSVSGHENWWVTATLLSYEAKFTTKSWVNDGKVKAFFQS